MEKGGPPVKINSITEVHRMIGIPGPLHPLISLIDNVNLNIALVDLPDSFLVDFYKISYKEKGLGKLGYGQGLYDFDEGGLVFTAPNQLISIEEDTARSGLSLLFHADLLRNYPLGQHIRKYGFFSYDINEALHLSEKERDAVLQVFRLIGDELKSPIDDFSQDVLISYIEVLLNYSNRFYKRQFITRKAVNHDLLTRMERLLEEYFNQDSLPGLPTVEYLARSLHLSPRYLSDMLRSLTGQSAQQHIHDKLIERAKEYLTATNLSVAEISYQLGFERPQSFNKLFKKKMNISPLEFKHSFD